MTRIRLANTRSVSDSARWNLFMPDSTSLKVLRSISRPWLESVQPALLLQELQASAGAR